MPPGRRLGALQLLVLHFQFDLVDLQFVQQGPRVGFGRGRIALAAARLQTLLRLAAQLGRFGRSPIRRLLLLHGCALFLDPPILGEGLLEALDLLLKLLDQLGRADRSPHCAGLLDALGGIHRIRGTEKHAVPLSRCAAFRISIALPLRSAARIVSKSGSASSKKYLTISAKMLRSPQRDNACSRLKTPPAGSCGRA